MYSTPIKIFLEVVAIIWALVTPKHTFVVVDKNDPSVSTYNKKILRVV